MMAAKDINDLLWKQAIERDKQEREHNKPFYEAIKVEEEIIVNEKGGKQHKVEGRFDLLPPFALDRIAKILEQGSIKYGDWNWTKIPSKDHLNHAINHLFKLVAGDTSEDHVGNAGCRILFLLDMLHRESVSVSGMTDETIDKVLYKNPRTPDEDTFPVDKNSGKIYEESQCRYPVGDDDAQCSKKLGHVGNHSIY